MKYCPTCQSPVEGKKTYCSRKCVANSPLTIEKRKQTNLEKYGVEAPAQNRSIVEKMRFSIQSRDKNEKECIVEKRKQTNLEKYGVEAPAQNQEILDKIKSTNQERYGTDWGLSNPEVKARIRHSNRSKNEGKHNFQAHLSKETLALLNNKEWLVKEYETKSASQIANEIGCGYLVVLNRLREYGVEKIKQSYFSSKEEDMLNEMLSVEKVIRHDRSILQGKEIDLYIPTLKLGIEVNGLFWHSEKMKGKSYHLDKLILATKTGVSLIQFWDFEVKEKFQIVKSMIESKIGKTTKIAARNCVIKQPTKNEEREFFNANHLQGFTNSSFCIGLTYDDQFVSMMSFGKPRFNKYFQVELLRFANKIGHTVVGGASKLFNRRPRGGIISYCDRRYSVGNLYRNLGMKESGVSSPNYWYTSNFKTLYNRVKFQKHKLEKQLENFDPHLSEYQNMQNNGYERVWDCGNLVFTL
jgi:hypothetical protein